MAGDGVVGPREEKALRALAHARAEDAKDASLPPCKLCGGLAIRSSWIGGESTGGGFQAVACERGDQDITIRLDERRTGFCSWGYWTWGEAEAEVLRRWRTLNG